MEEKPKAATENPKIDSFDINGGFFFYAID